MPLNLKLGLGDRLILSDERTGGRTFIEIDQTRRGRVRLCIDAPKHVKIDRQTLDERISAEAAAVIPGDPNGPVSGGAA